MKRMLLTCALTAGLVMPLSAQGRTVTVQMKTLSPTSFAFEPREIRASPGDTVTFVQEGTMPHNVQFLRVPTGAALGAAMMGPFLARPGDVYRLVMDQRFVAGTYDITCTPHQMMGMMGQLTVVAR